MKKLFLFGASYLFLLCAVFACEQPDDPAQAATPAEEARNHSEGNPYAVTCEEAEAVAFAYPGKLRIIYNIYPIQ